MVYVHISIDIHIDTMYCIVFSCRHDVVFISLEPGLSSYLFETNAAAG